MTNESSIQTKSQPTSTSTNNTCTTNEYHFENQIQNQNQNQMTCKGVKSTKSAKISKNGKAGKTSKVSKTSKTKGKMKVNVKTMNSPLAAPAADNTANTTTTTTNNNNTAATVAAVTSGNNKSKPICRCVSICNENENENDNSKGTKLMLSSSSSSSSSLQSSVLSRKRPRPDSFVDAISDQPLMILPLQNKRMVCQNQIHDQNNDDDNNNSNNIDTANKSTQKKTLNGPTLSSSSQSEPSSSSSTFTSTSIFTSKEDKGQNPSSMSLSLIVSKNRKSHQNQHNLQRPCRVDADADADLDHVEEQDQHCHHGHILLHDHSFNAIGKCHSKPIDPNSKINVHTNTNTKTNSNVNTNINLNINTPFSPASPVRSVVSCDGSQFDLDIMNSVHGYGNSDENGNDNSNHTGNDVGDDLHGVDMDDNMDHNIESNMDSNMDVDASVTGESMTLVVDHDIDNHDVGIETHSGHGEEQGNADQKENRNGDENGNRNDLRSDENVKISEHRVASIQPLDYEPCASSSSAPLVPESASKSVPASATPPSAPSPAAQLNHVQLHIRALQIEASLAPMKPLLSRLMAHPTHNRRGTFNTAVDHVALGLVDYTKIVQRPMDLGTVKKKLHSSIYTSHADVASDVRLCFRNAMLFNPPTHPVHEAAAQLLSFFEKSYKSILEEREEYGDHNHDYGHKHSCSSASPSSSPSPSSSHPQQQQQPQLQAPLLPLPATAHPFSYTPPAPAKHTCQSCLGRRCKICKEKCLGLEPTLVICAGAPCAGAKIRRGTLYYCSVDGQKAWCPKCYSTLPAVLPSDEVESDQPSTPLATSLSTTSSSQSGTTSSSDMNVPAVRYKRNLLKRRNDEDIVERWLSCRRCGAGVHEICAFANEFSVDPSSYECTLCSQSVLPKSFDNYGSNSSFSFGSSTVSTTDFSNDVYSFLSGQDNPEKIKHTFGGSSLDCRTLPSCPIAEFIELKLRQQMLSMNCPPHAEETLTVRIISDSEKVFQVPDFVRRHFRQNMESVPGGARMNGISEFSEPPSEVGYESKAIALFQRIDGMDVCLFCMYVQEYGEESNNLPGTNIPSKRVYVAYLDSVEHLRPRELRTNIYHEILVAYLATARARGYSHAHIWSCPPSRGNSFVFWGHPPLQRTPTKDRLLSWYHHAICRGLNRGVITDVKSLYEYSFEEFEKDFSNNNKNRSTGTLEKSQPIMICPPILEGDFWLEEASRVHSSSVARYFRTKKPVTNNSESFVPKDQFSENGSNCPAMHVAAVLQDDIMAHPSATPFCRPVNAAALKLHDYHDIIKNPMDLGSVITQCLLGEYDTFGQIIHDIELVFKNAMRYNPKGHIIHTLATDLLQYSRTQLLCLVSFWKSCGVGSLSSGTETDKATIEDFNDLSMRLGAFISRNEEQSMGHNQPDSSSSSPKNNQGKKSISNKINLLTGGPGEVAKRMVGSDTWLLEKKHAYKPVSKNKAKKEKAKSTCSDGMFKQHECWLGDEVLAIVRRLRSDFFVCDLHQNDDSSITGRVKDEEFEAYIAGFDFTMRNPRRIKTQCYTQPSVADTRHGLLEFSQYRNFQFDTIRRAKYSTAMILFYLRHQNEPGIIPLCTSCREEIKSVRWRRVNKAFDERRRSSQTLSVRLTSVDMTREELCQPCYNALHKKDAHVPIRVSFSRRRCEIDAETHQDGITEDHQL